MKKFAVILFALAAILPATAKTPAFITPRIEQGKLLLDIHRNTFDREMLIASTLSEISSQQFGTIGYKENKPVLIRLTLADSVVHLRQVNTEQTTDYIAPAAMKRVNIDPVISAFPIEKRSADSTLVTIDATSLFLENPPRFDFFPAASAIDATPTFKREDSSLDSAKGFADNLSVRATLVFAIDSGAAGDQPVTARVTRSILLLPETRMKPRLSDSRVGVFSVEKTRFASDSDIAKPYSVATRWRVVPADTAAYMRGELVEPAQKITFYIDPDFPELWKKPIEEALTGWNRAFESIGFKNVVEARDFPAPAQDPEFDPDNLRYSCVRFVPSTTVNAMGPSWVNPRTGEIINASILVYSNVSELINKWRFVQTAQVDPRVRTRKMPDEIMRESLRYVLAHEAGHCLGFQHNMASSAAFPVDSLRSPSFTRKYGTTPSIMDYARMNYIAQPADTGVGLTPPDLGAYDYFLVKWTYAFLPQYQNERDEAPTVESWVDATAGDPIYRYGRQQLSSRYDPSAIEEDLSDDPLRAGDYGIANLKYILRNMNDWIADDHDYSHRLMLYNEITAQYFRYVRNVMLNIGGIYLTEVKAGTPGQRIRPVTRTRQKEALRWVMNQYRTLDWLDEPRLKSWLPLGVGGAAITRQAIAANIAAQIRNVILSSHYADDPYTVDEFLDDLYAETWRTTIRRRTPSPGEMALQKTMVDLFCTAVKKVSSNTADQDTDLAPRNFGSPGPGFQYEVDISAIDTSAASLASLALRSRNLLRRAIITSNGTTRAHYEALLLELGTALR